MMIRDLPSLLLAGVLAVLVVAAPLPFGSVTLEARTWLQLGIALALALAALCRPAKGFAAVRWPVLALALLAAWGSFQSLPLPRALVATVSPQRVALADGADEVLGRPAADRLALSVAPDLSRRNAVWWAALAAVLGAAAVAGRQRRHRRVLAGALIAVAGFEVLYGTSRWSAGGSSLIWGVAVPGGGQRLRGTFVNPDHLSLFLELSLAVAGAAIWWAARRSRRAGSLEARILLLTPPLLAWLALFAAIAFTGSRAGLLAAVLATIAQGVVAALPQRRWGLAPAGVGLAVLGIAAVAAVGLQQGLGRWLATSPYELTWNSRRVAYASTLELWQRFPWTGTGMASFRDAFPLVQPATIPGGWWHAHNDWLEALATLGLPGAALLLAGLGALVHRLFQVLAVDNRAEDRAAALAAYGALAAVAVHSALDFGLTLPANALALTVLVGAAAAAPLAVSGELAKTRRRRDRPRAELPPPPAADAEPPAPDALPPPAARPARRHRRRGR
jgi:O-antigen ligase